MNMLKYAGKRILLMLPTLFGITVLTFAIVHLAPGGPVDQKLQGIRFSNGQTSASTAGPRVISPEVVAALKKQYGFDKPLIERYWLWLKRVMSFHFGKSYIYQRPVMQVIEERLPVSLTFGITSFILTYAVSIPLGVLMAAYRGRALDSTISFGLVAVAAIPVFMLGILFLVFLAGGSFLHIFPIGYLQSDNYASLTTLGKFLDRLHHFILPLVCYMVGSFTTLSLLGRNYLVEEIGKDYARMARSKGLSERRILVRHALRNALIPLSTGIGGVLGVFLSGSVLVESVFQIPGVGLLGFEAVLGRDYNVLMALIFLSSLTMLFGNLFGDLLYMVIDPTVDFE